MSTATDMLAKYLAAEQAVLETKPSNSANACSAWKTCRNRAGRQVGAQGRQRNRRRQRPAHRRHRFQRRADGLTHEYRRPTHRIFRPACRRAPRPDAQRTGALRNRQARQAAQNPPRQPLARPAGAGRRRPVACPGAVSGTQSRPGRGAAHPGQQHRRPQRHRHRAPTRARSTAPSTKTTPRPCARPGATGVKPRSHPPPHGPKPSACWPRLAARWRMLRPAADRPGAQARPRHPRAFLAGAVRGRHGAAGL